MLPDLTAFPAWLDEHVLGLRLDALAERLRSLGSVLVAFSGGADSALLLAAAVRALGPERVAAATAHSDSLPQAERDPARAFAESLGVRVLTPTTNEMEREGYRANAGDRCYFCKAELIEVLAPLAAEHGLAHVATGTNADDAVAGFRPGIRAAGRARRGHTAARRRLHQGPGARRVPRLGAADLGQAGRGLPVQPGRLRHRGHAPSGWPGSSGRRPGSGPRWPRPGSTVRDLRVRDLGDRASVEVDAGRGGRGPRRWRR